MSKSPSRLVLALASAGVIATLLSGCSIIQGVFNPASDATRDETGQVVEGNDNGDVFLMRVGDCLNDSSVGTEVTSVPIVPCSEPHDSEIFSELRLTGSEFPGDEFITQQADEHCEAAFADFVGVDWNSSELYLSYYTPTQGSWEQMNDRLISCIIYDQNGQTTGSLKGAGR